MYNNIIKQKKIKELSERAYDSAKKKGFLSDSADVMTEMMLVISEIVEIVQADRHNKHCDIEAFKSLEGITEEEAYDKYINDTIESELADTAIRMFSLLGWFKAVGSIEFMVDNLIANRINMYFNEFQMMRFNLPQGLYHIVTIGFLRVTELQYSPAWYIADKIQESLCRVFAFAKYLDIDLLEHIYLKMKYNESRPYLHGCKY